MNPTDRKPEDLQKQGTREFDEAVAGKGPKMPPREISREDEAELNEALEDTFPASDPPAVSSNKTSPGAPKGRRSVE